MLSPVTLVQSFPFALAMILFLNTMANPLRADLILEISGVPGSNQTTWTFSGFAVAGSDNQFDSGSLSEADVWNDVGDMWTVFFQTVTTPAVPAGATVQVGSEVRTIDELYIDHDILSNDDEFGIGIDGTGPLVFTSGQTITWSGAFTLAGADVQNMNPGTYTGKEHGGLGLEIRIAAVPEPGCLAIACLFVAIINRHREKRIA